MGCVTIATGCVSKPKNLTSAYAKIYAAECYLIVNDIDAVGSECTGASGNCPGTVSGTTVDVFATNPTYTTMLLTSSPTTVNIGLLAILSPIETRCAHLVFTLPTSAV